MKMGRSHVSLKRALFVSGLAAVAMFSTTAMAAESSAPADKTTAAAATQKTTAQASEAAATTAATGRTTGVITATGAAESDSQASMPAVTTSSSSSKLALPTLSTTNNGAVPTYPAPSVPPTADAPFMQHSNLPDGTVFIAVGAILGGFGAAILIWRAVVAYLLHRSIARAALAQHLGSDKAQFASTSAVPLYRYSDRDSTLNLGGGPIGGGGAGGGAGTGRGVRRTNRGPTPSATPSQTNLFFSPTAPGAAGAAGIAGAVVGGGGSGNNRESRLLPSGFYAAGAAAPAGAPHGQAISMTNLSNLSNLSNPSNLRPDSYVNARATGGPSPPDSPSLGPLQVSAASHNMGGSMVSLTRPPSGRAPSAFLDDLLDEQHHQFAPSSGSQHEHFYSPTSQGNGRY